MINLENAPVRIPMKKRGHYNEFSNKRTGHKNAKAFKSRRAAIKRGEYSEKALFGYAGCSSYWW